jgi:ferrochelatase
VPVGFISDHLEVLFDLDHEAAEKSHELGLQMVRIPTVGTDPQFITMIRELIQERTGENVERLALGCLGPWHDVCPRNCCQLGTDSAPLPTVAERR